MQNRIITISDNGTVTVPSQPKMNITEIAELFGIYYKTAKQHIRAIEKSGVANGDIAMDCEAEGLNIYPCYYGLEMIIAVAFRVQSKKAEIFRNWLMKKVIASQIVVRLTHKIQPTDKYNLN